MNRAIQALGLNESQYNEIKRLLPGQKLEAIARYIEITKVNKAEARAVIDAIQAGAVPGGGPAIIGADIERVPLSDSQRTELLRMLPDRKIEAVKLCRRWTKVGLAEAKDIVDALERGAEAGGRPEAAAMTGALGTLHLSDEQNAELRRLLRTDKEAAIAFFRARTPLGYEEAKDIVEVMAAGTALEASLPGASASRSSSSPTVPGNVAGRLAELLPPGSRPPTPGEAETIGGHVARGAFDDAALQIGAGWGVDPDAALKIAKGLRSRGASSVLGCVFFLIAMTLGLGLLGGIVWFIQAKP